ncbi:hypothetical protein [Nonomuraea dietziae]|uniref:Uncharacterized protein n=1 Tax=Nonomuraea dietziae TaxID=65515 RepID=A0A7W5Y9D0_9ACTN|nr:hypothetical protein [Nonomuraea dietziae]MBB3729381.1 hypothetical protein [Nonomuraea dietziae]
MTPHEPHHPARRHGLVRHLLGVEPPEGYRLTPVPLDLDLIGESFA